MAAARAKIADSAVGHDPHFRWRGSEVGRAEAFSDCVLAFALTLLVVALEVPRTFAQLMNAMQGFIAFGICFFIFYRIWAQHHGFFRRYGLQDSITIGLNGLLLFLVMAYVYPLKFLFSLLFSGSTLSTGTVITGAQVPTLFLLYGAGFAGVYLCFGLMYGHALRSAKALDLNEYETAVTKVELLRCLLLAGLAVLTTVFAYLLPPGVRGLAGLLYTLVGPVEGYAGWRFGELRRGADAQASE